MIFILFFCFQASLAFLRLNATHQNVNLYKNFVIFQQDSYIAYSKLTTPQSFSIIDENKTHFCHLDQYLATWNEENITGYILYPKINSSDLVPEIAFRISNKFSTNITISSHYFLALYDNGSLYVFDMLNKDSQTLDIQILQSYDDIHTPQTIYRYNEKIAFQYLNTDHRIHAITLSDEVKQINEKIWFSLQNGKFSTTFWNNGTAFFMNSSKFNYTVPLNVLFWYHQDSQITMKYLFEIQDAHIFAIFTNKALCYQYYAKNLTQPYQNILCMKVEQDYYEIVDVNSEYKLQILLKNNKTNELALDYYNQCLLYQTLNVDESCSLCLSGECYNECHSLKQYRCSETYRMRTSLPFVMISLCLGLMIASIAISILKVIKQSFSFTLQLLALLLRWLCWDVPKILIVKFKRYYVRLRRKITPLPLQDIQTCPICLGEVIAPRYFPCKRHSACLDCFDQYESTFVNSQIKCPYRD